MRNHLHIGDTREWAKSLPPKSIQAIVTSPPYFGLRSYLAPDHPDKGAEMGSEASPREYVAALVALFGDLRQALRDDGVAWINLGDSYSGGGGYWPDAPSNQAGSLSSKHGPNGAGTTQYKGRQPTPGLKPKDLIGIPWRVALALQDAGWYLRSDIIWHKCLSGGATVYAKTQKGVMPMMVRDLVRLRPETVQLWNGERWTRCVAWSETPRPERPIEIELRSGERVGCTPEHQWPTQRGNVRADELTIGDTIQTTTLPDTDNLGPPALPQSVAWVIGLFIAEGNRDGDYGVRFSLNADEQPWVADLRRFAHYYGGTCREHSNGNTLAVICEGRLLRAVIDTYVAGDGSKGKHLTTAAWQRDNAFLRELLTGYLAGDGHLDAKNQRWRIGFTANDALAQDLRTLGARLGATVRLRRVNHTTGDKTHPGWRGEVRWERSNHHNNKDQGEIVALRASRARRFYDISVEDDPHLFALASGVLTHNSNPMPESVTDRPTRSHEYVFLLSKGPRYFYDAEAIAEPSSEIVRRPNVHNQAPNPAFRAPGQATVHDGETPKTQFYPATRNRRSVWTIPTVGFPSAHFATFPPDLIRPCIRAGSSERGACMACGAPWKRRVERSFLPQQDVCEAKRAKGSNKGMDASNGWGDVPRGTVTAETTGWSPSCRCGTTETRPCVVADPFAGSCTTGQVCVEEGRDYVLCDLDERARGWLAQRLAPLPVARLAGT